MILDLHMPDEKDFTPALVKSYLLAAKCILGISIWNDAEALAVSYGVATLLDRINLGSELIPATMPLVRISFGLKTSSELPTRHT